MSAKDEVSGGLESVALVESVESADHSKPSDSAHISKEAPSSKEEKHDHVEVHSSGLHVEDAKKESHESPESEEKPENSKQVDKSSDSSSSEEEKPENVLGEIELKPEAREEIKQGINTYLDKAKELAIHNKYVIGGLTVAGLITFAAFKKLKKRS